VRNHSVWTANSVRTGGLSADYRQEDDDDVYDNDRSEQHEFQGIPSILVAKDTEESDSSVLTRDNLEATAGGQGDRGQLHRPSTETIAQAQTNQASPISECPEESKENMKTEVQNEKWELEREKVAKMEKVEDKKASL
jgi:hypothetical protein